MDFFRTKSPSLGILAGTAFGVSTYLLRFLPWPSHTSWFVSLSITYLFVIPFLMGAAAVFFGGEKTASSDARCALTPLACVALAVVALLLLRMEGAICIVMASPGLACMAMIGGLVTGIFLRAKKKRAEKQNNGLLAIFLLPLAAGPLEQRLPTPVQFREVRTRIEIAAAPETVWRNIRSVPRIAPGENPFSLVHAIGFPKPVEAALYGEGVGAVRHATFDGGVLFVETVTDWRPNEAIAFTIRADTKSIPPTTLDEHVTIGGPYFDVLEGSYRIEVLGPKKVLLHLKSRHRLSTRFNFYAGAWTDFVMRDIQNSILKVIRARCEAS